MLDLWAVDEVHFQQYGSRCRMWIPPEDADPVLPHHPTRKSVGYFGAVRLRDGTFLRRQESGKFNAETFWQFLLQLFEQSHSAGKRVILIVDNARYHHAKLHRDWRQACDDSFHLNYLPPYSPDLNPIERVWKLTRKLCIHDHYFGHLSEVVQAVETQFEQWTDGHETLRKLCAI